MAVTDDNYFEHKADMGIIGYGSTIEEAFVNAAEAMFGFMVEDLSKIKKDCSVTVEFEEVDLEMAFVMWLNLLLAQARIQNLILGQFSLQRKNDHWTGEGRGEAWSDQIARGTEVKGATLTMLSVKQSKNGWEAKCVVDV